MAAPVINPDTRMNKTETKYSVYLDTLISVGEIEEWKFEPVGLRLAGERCFYHPDFMVVYSDRFEIHEIKAFNRKARKPLIQDDALVKIKVAASQFKWWVFKIVWFDTYVKHWDCKIMRP